MPGWLEWSASAANNSHDAANRSVDANLPKEDQGDETTRAFIQMLWKLAQTAAPAQAQTRHAAIFRLGIGIPALSLLLVQRSYARRAATDSSVRSGMFIGIGTNNGLRKLR